MLKVAGELSGSTNTWMVGPKTMSAHVIPALALMVTAALLVFLLPHLARQCIATAFFLGGTLGSPAFADIRAISLPRMEGVLVSGSREGEYARALRKRRRLAARTRCARCDVDDLGFCKPLPSAA